MVCTYMQVQKAKQAEQEAALSRTQAGLVRALEEARRSRTEAEALQVQLVEAKAVMSEHMRGQVEALKTQLVCSTIILRCVWN